MRLLDALTSSGDAAVLVATPELEITEASRGAEQLFNIPRESLKGVKLHALLEPLPLPPADGAQASVDSHARRGAVQVPVRVLWTRDGESVVALLIDLERLARSPFTESSSLSRFASMVAHEIRNPLSSIKIVVQTLARGQDVDERTARRMAIAAREIRTVERILSALSELARPAELKPVRSELAAVVADAVAASEAELKDREVLVKTSIEPGLPPVPHDLAKLRLAIGHLLVNAAHGIGRGGEIHIEVIGAADGVTLLIHDTAPQGAAQAAGAGLSLAMVEKIARAHGGQLTMEASATGSRARLFLPIDPAEPAQ